MMAFSIEGVLFDTRTAGITIDHIKNTDLALKNVSSIPSRDIFDRVAATIKPRMIDEKLEISREAAAYLSLLCSGKARIERCCDFPQPRSTKLELPLLTTDHEEDLINFKKAIETKRMKYLEPPETLDILMLEQRLEAQDTRTRQKAHHRYEIGPEPFKIPKDSVKHLQNLIDTKKLPKGHDIFIDHDDRCPSQPVSPLMPHEYVDLPPIVNNLSLAPQETMEPGREDLVLPDSRSIGESLLTPLGSRDNPLDVDSLETVFARCSMTPEVGDHKQKQKQRMKLSSPLTPPNTVRPHRRFTATDAETLFHDINLAPPQRMPSSSSLTAKDGAEFHQARTIVGARIATEQVQPRLVARKIDLPNLGPVGHLSNQPMEWDYETLRQFRSILNKNFLKLRLPDPDDKCLLWPPWAPHTFDPHHFRARFELPAIDESEQITSVSSPLDPRSLICFEAEDEEGYELLDAANFPDPNDFTIILKKRKLETMQHREYRDKKQKSLHQDHATTFEDSFLEAGLHLMASETPKLFRLASTKPDLPRLETRHLIERFDTPTESLLPATKLAPPVIGSLQELQPVVVSSGIPARRVMRAIHKQNVHIEDIERDFTAIWPADASSSNDADILISPTVGILLTTISEISQRSLPGSEKLPKFHTKLIEVALKFDKLFVLVEANVVNSPVYQTLMEINEFVLQESVASNTEIKILSHKGEDQQAQQAREVLSIAGKYHVSKHAFSLTEDETHGELWLRHRAGINTYAAQAILEHTGKTFNVGRGQALASLRRMSNEDRRQRLKSLVGSKCVERLNIALLRYQDALVEMELKAKDMYN